MECYWNEPVDDIKRILVSGVCLTQPDIKSSKDFIEKVIKREKNDEILKIAREMLNYYNKLDDELKSYKNEKISDKKLFESEYAKLFQTYGTKGDIKILEKTSTKDDEQKLKKLREHILWRNSDEALYDYDEISRIIVYNRWSK